jgi:hypothetical protein
VTGTICAKHPSGRSGKWCLSPFSRNPARSFSPSFGPRASIPASPGSVDSNLTSASGRLGRLPEVKSIAPIKRLIHRRTPKVLPPLVEPRPSSRRLQLRTLEGSPLPRDKQAILLELLVLRCKRGERQALDKIRNIIEQSELKTREKLLDIENRLAELAETAKVGRPGA